MATLKIPTHNLLGLSVSGGLRFLAENFQELVERAVEGVVLGDLLLQRLVLRD